MANGWQPRRFRVIRPSRMRRCYRRSAIERARSVADFEGRSVREGPGLSTRPCWFGDCDSRELWVAKMPGGPDSLRETGAKSFDRSCNWL